MYVAFSCLKNNSLSSVFETIYSGHFRLKPQRLKIFLLLPVQCRPDIAVPVLDATLPVELPYPKNYSQG